MVTVRYEVLLAGQGGQGVILAAVMLAEAAATYDGKNVAQTQSYGPEARGSSCKAEVVISDEDIDYPKVTRADLVLAMSQEACDKCGHYLKEEGILIVDSILVDHVARTGAYRVPLTSIAEQANGRRLTANLVALGLIVALTGIVSLGAIEAALAARAPKGTRELNLRALHAGLQAAESLHMSQRQPRRQNRDCGAGS
jgi:2-oxoglutarate ferredoxin oxidoreductase subunit gamma